MKEDPLDEARACLKAAKLLCDDDKTSPTAAALHEIAHALSKMADAMEQIQKDIRAK